MTPRGTTTGSWSGSRAERTDGEVGILFRATGADDYYRFSMNRELRYRRLVKAAGGSFTVLFEDGVSFQQDRDDTRGGQRPPREGGALCQGGCMSCSTRKASGR